jgi:spore germination cell wall hydrolase CwlJ-like protein
MTQCIHFGSVSKTFVRPRSFFALAGLPIPILFRACKHLAKLFILRRGQLAIAAVVFNRIKSPEYPKTVVAVVTDGANRGKGCDFSYTCDGKPEAVKRWDSWFKLQASYALAGTVLGVYNTTGYYYDPTGGALTYQTVAGKDTGWFGLFNKCAVIGQHKFYCKKKAATITANSSP